MIKMEEKKLFLIVYLSNSQSYTNNVYIVSNTKIEATVLFMREISIKELKVTNIIDFGIINDSDLAALTKQLDKRDNAPLWFD